MPDNNKTPENRQIPELMKWIDSPRFSYMFFWPYELPFTPIDEEIDIRVKPYEEKYHGKTFIGTFITQSKLLREFDEVIEQKEYANGIYIPLRDFSDRLLVKEISDQAVIKTIDDLLTRDSFEEFFDEERE